jgi:hypothetical protein
MFGILTRRQRVKKVENYVPLGYLMALGNPSNILVFPRNVFTLCLNLALPDGLQTWLARF